MRTLKRTLALILALVMVLGVMTMGASATKLEELGGSDKVADAYRVAMGVQVGMGVFQGDEKGELNAEATVTRAEMARLLYAVVTGDVDSKSTPSISTQVFNDVPTTHWAVAYINWAQASGYVVGYGDGNFGPSDTVTGYQAMLMLLQALGYNKQGEIGGADYAIQTHTWAAKVGLTKNVSANYNNGAARQEIAQYIYDMLKITRVFWSDDAKDYANTDSLTGFSSSYTFGLANFNYNPNEDYHKLGESMIASMPTSKGKIDIITEIVSTRASATDVATYDYDADRTEVGRVADIYVSNKGVVYYVDILSEDVVVASGISEANYKKAITTPYTKTLGAGAYVFANYATDETRTTITGHKVANGICAPVIQTQGGTYVIYDGKVASVLYSNMTVERVIVDKDGNVTLQKSGDDITKDYVYKGDENLAKRGKYYMNCVEVDGVYTLTDVETITAKATRYYASDSAVTVNGTKYDLRNAKADSTGKITDTDTNDNSGLVTVVYNSSGNRTGGYDYTTSSIFTWYVSGVTGKIIGVETEDIVDSNTYGYVVDATTTLGTHYARIVLTDGTNKTYETDKDYSGVYNASSNTDGREQEPVIISLDSDGVAELERGGFTKVTTSGAVSDPFSKYDATSKLSITAYVNEGNFVYLKNNDSSSGVTYKSGTHSSKLLNGTIVWVKLNDSKVITAAFIEQNYSQGSYDSSSYYFYDGATWNEGSNTYVELFNLETGASGNYKVDAIPSGNTKAVYALDKTGSTYYMRPAGYDADNDGTADVSIINQRQINSIKSVSGKSYSMINNAHSIDTNVVVMDQDNKFAIGDLDDLYTGDYISYAFNSDGEIIGAVLLKNANAGNSTTTPVTPVTSTNYYYISDDGTGTPTYTIVNLATGTTSTTTTAPTTYSAAGIYSGVTASGSTTYTAVTPTTNKTNPYLVHNSYYDAYLINGAGSERAAATLYVYDASGNYAGINTVAKLLALVGSVANTTGVAIDYVVESGVVVALVITA